MLARIIVVEFGGAASAFEALDPREYVVNGAARPILQLGREFK